MNTATYTLRSHQVAGTVRAARHPLASGLFTLKVDRKDGKSADMVSGVDNCTAVSFYSREAAQAEAEAMNRAA